MNQSAHAKDAWLTIPNIITALRIVGVPVLCWSWFENASWGLVLFVALAATDMLDGFVARSLGAVSTLGEALDPLADKLLVISTSMRALWLIALQGFVLFCVSIVPFIVIVAREGLVWWYWHIATKKGIRTPSLWMGKAKMWFECGALAFILATSDQSGAWYFHDKARSIGMEARDVGIVLLYLAALLAGLSLWQLKRHYPALFNGS